MKINEYKPYGCWYAREKRQQRKESIQQAALTALLSFLYIIFQSI